MSGRGDGVDHINSIDFQCFTNDSDKLRVYEAAHPHAAYDVILEMNDVTGKAITVFLDADKAFELSVAIVAVAQNHKNRSK